jgi:hypothetical protein
MKQALLHQGKHCRDISEQMKLTLTCALFSSMKLVFKRGGTLSGPGTDIAATIKGNK